MLGKIINHKTNKLVIEFEEDINPEYLKLLTRGGEGLANVDLIDHDPRSIKQNALAHVLIRDISKDEGEPEFETQKTLKAIFSETYGYEFKHSEASKTEMNKWIEFLIEYVIYHGIKLPKRYSHLLDYNKFFYFSCKYRKCCICGLPHAQMHHVNAVGNQSRKHVDHRKFPFASLCWVHHNIGHNIGVERLLEEYLITPVYLDSEALIKIGIMSNAQILRFDEKYETEGLYLKANGG